MPWNKSTLSVLNSPASTTKFLVTMVFAGDAGLQVYAEKAVENGVGDLVRDLVGMALGNRLGGEEIGSGHTGPLSPALSPATVGIPSGQKCGLAAERWFG